MMTMGALQFWLGAMTIVGTGLLAVVAYEVATDGLELRLVPQCLRCGRPRDWGHTCSDAEGEVVDR